MVRYWGASAAVGSNASMPKEYGLLYNSLVNQRVTFPSENKFLNSPPTDPGASPNSRNSPQLGGSRGSSPQPARREEVKPVVASHQNYPDAEQSLEEIKQLREGFVRMAMKDPFDQGTPH